MQLGHFHRSHTSRVIPTQHMQRGNMGRFSEWFWFSTVWSWTGDDLTNVIGNLFIMDRFPIGAKISLDEFVFELPSSKSFAQPSNVCTELAINGDAENNDGNGYSHYPFMSDNSYSNPLIYEETISGNVNRFYRIRARNSYYVSLQFRPNTACFVKGHVYTISLRMRLYSYNPTERMKLYIRLTGRKPTGDMAYPTILRCPEMSQSNEWTTCSAILLVGEELSSLTDTKWETITEMENSTNPALIDFDDISIKYKSGVSFCFLCIGRFHMHASIYHLKDMHSLCLCTCFSLYKFIVPYSRLKDLRSVGYPVGQPIRMFTLLHRRYFGGIHKMP